VALRKWIPLPENIGIITTREGRGADRMYDDNQRKHLTKPTDKKGIKVSRGNTEKSWIWRIGKLLPRLD